MIKWYSPAHACLQFCFSLCECACVCEVTMQIYTSLKDFQAQLSHGHLYSNSVHGRTSRYAEYN